MAKSKKGNSQIKPNQESNSLDLENQLKRALADYQNLERRVEAERRLLGELSSAIVVEKMLPVLDNLESAQSHLDDQGLSLVIKQFKDVLESEGVSEIEAVGQSFDPNLHEAAEVEVGDEDGKIVKVLAKGYKINDKVLRPAKVIVTKKSTSAQNTEEDQVDVIGQDVNVEERVIENE